MDETYTSHGVTFQYPSDWELSETDEGGQITVSVSSPRTAFWTMSLFLDCPEPDDVVEAVLDAFREEYAEMDDYASRSRLCEGPTVARDIDFVCLELLNSARVRACRAGAFTVMVLYQWTEAEKDEILPILEKITGSVKCPAGQGDE